MNSRNMDIFLVGSVSTPGDTSEEAMRMCADAFGDRLFAMPDGEVGVRWNWAGSLGETTWSKHPAIEADPDTNYAREWNAEGHVRIVRRPYRIKQTDDDLSLVGYLPYADAAIAAYPVFRKLRRDGLIGSAARFQVAIPTPHAAVCLHFPDVGRWGELFEAYRDGIYNELSKVLAVIPASDLAIQWDYCTELMDVVGSYTGRHEFNKIIPWIPKGTSELKFVEHTNAEYIRPLSEGIPEDVLVGYHLCLGTRPQFPTTTVRDIALPVRIANAIVAHSDRRIDWMHLPVTPTADEAFFAPLQDLDTGPAAIFLGIGASDGIEANVKRGRAAQKFLPAFGISHYCGYGREEGPNVPRLLNELRETANVLFKTSR